MCERRKPYKTDTQHKINLSGYHWGSLQMGDLSDKVVLDNACGTGYGSSFLAKKAKKVIGIDISEEAIEYSRKNFKEENLEYLVMNSESLSLPDNSFDHVISQDTIEHVPNDELFLEKISRVLKKNGTLIIFTAQGKGKAFKPENIYHIREYTKDEFDKLLSKYFREIKFFGRRKGESLKSVENEMNKVRKYDPFYLRRIIPRRIRHLLGSFLTRRKLDISLNEILLQHIDYLEDVREDTNLIAVCRK